jgi:aldehyde:ferredoxin oxidoreductase
MTRVKVPFYLDESNIKGSKSKNLVFDVNGIKFIKKFLTNIIKNKVLEENYICMDCIGKCTRNIYNDKSYLQIEIVDLIIK